MYNNNMDNLYIKWYGFQARISAILHKIRHPKHRLLWRTNVDEICPGDIVCETCDQIFWCRAQEKPIKGG